MIKTIKAAIIVLCLLISASAFSQSSQKANQVDSVAMWNKFRDSAMSHTSLAQFQQWLYENATVKQYQESKFVDLYNAFVQYQMQLFIKPKNRQP